MKKIICRDTGETFFTYKQYLFSRHWKQIKERFHASKTGQRGCFVCKAKPYDIHHRTYARIGNESLNDLVALCRDHHLRLHDRVVVQDRKKLRREHYRLCRTVAKHHLLLDWKRSFRVEEIIWQASQARSLREQQSIVEKHLFRPEGVNAVNCRKVFQRAARVARDYIWRELKQRNQVAPDVPIQKPKCTKAPYRLDPMWRRGDKIWYACVECKTHRECIKIHAAYENGEETFNIQCPVCSHILVKRYTWKT